MTIYFQDYAGRRMEILFPAPDAYWYSPPRNGDRLELTTPDGRIGIYEVRHVHIAPTDAVCHVALVGYTGDIRGEGFVLVRRPRRSDHFFA